MTNERPAKMVSPEVYEQAVKNAAAAVNSGDFLKGEENMMIPLGDFGELDPLLENINDALMALGSSVFLRKVSETKKGRKIKAVVTVSLLACSPGGKMHTLHTYQLKFPSMF